MGRTMKVTVSIIIPVHNETHIICRTISHLLNLKSNEDFEIIVVDGSLYRNTIDCIQEPPIRKTVSKKGRGAQMNKGASLAKSDILLFLHADTLIPQDAIQRIQHVCRDTEVVAGAFALGIESDRIIYRIIERAVALRTRFTKIPYGDQAIFIKGNFFREIGGYRDIPIMEDVELMKRIKASGGKIALISQMVQTSPRRWETEGVLYCTLRNWVLIILYCLGVPPKKLAKFY
jgi:rSAM/selenodomain-associated transferase 2